MAANTEPDVAAQLDTIRSDLAALTKAVSQLASQTSVLKTSVTEGIIEDDEAMHGASGAVYDVEAEIARNPLAAVVISLSLGFMLGVLTRS